jgi:hypothetical protein
MTALYKQKMLKQKTFLQGHLVIFREFSRKNENSRVYAKFRDLAQNSADKRGPARKRLIVHCRTAYIQLFHSVLSYMLHYSYFIATAVGYFWFNDFFGILIFYFRSTVLSARNVRKCSFGACSASLYLKLHQSTTIEF